MATGASELQVHFARHPLRFETEEARVPLGQTIAEIIGRTDLPALVWADGELIECEHWTVVVPRHHLLIKRMPADRDVWRTVAFVAVSLLTYGAGTFFSGWTAAAVQAGVGIAGALAVNALIPPTMPEMEGGGGPQRLAEITGQSNRVTPFTPIPKVYGNPTYYPPIPMTGLPFTELVGEDQYFRMMVVLGYGPLRIGGHTVGEGHSKITHNTSLTGEPIKIGGTSIDQFDDMQFEIGTPDDVNLFTNSVVEEAVNVSMPRGGDPTDESDTVIDGSDEIRTTAPDSDEVTLDVYSPALFSVSGQGNTRPVRIDFAVHYRESGSGDPWLLGSIFSLGSSERKPKRKGTRIIFPATGQYDVRLTRTQTYYRQENDFFSDATWTVMRSIKRNVKPFNVPDTVVMALRIRATDQLGGRIERLSISASSILPVYDGSSWSEAITRNPAWIYADILSGNATRSAVPKSKLDADQLKSWADWCDTEGLHFDQVIDAEGTVFDRAREVAASGFGTWHVTDTAEYSVVMDEVSSPSMIVTPRNSFGFSSEYTFHKLPHALRVQFIDPDIWQPTERIVYDDGYSASNATNYEQLQTVGIADSDHAWKFGRYHLAQLRLRPETYHWSQDVQHLAYQRGDTIELSQDVILVGLKWGRIKSLTLDGSGDATKAEVDETLLMESGTDYGVKIQKQDGTVTTETIVNAAPSTTEIEFDSPVSGLNEGDHFTFGESGSESILVRVTRIEPQGDFKAAITAVPAAEDIFDAWDGSIPSFDPVITEPIDVSTLPVPVPQIEDVVSDESVLYRDSDGSLRVRMVVHTSTAPLPGWAGTEQIRYRVLGDDEWTRLPPENASNHSITDVEEGLTYEIQTRGVREGTDIVSAWSPTTSHNVVGKSNPPGDVPMFDADAARDRIELSWEAPEDRDLGRFEIREGADWDSGTLIAKPQGTSYQTKNVSNGPWWIKAIDTSGNYSDNATEATINVTLPSASSLRSQVIDNNVLLRWEQTIGTFDLARVEIRKGSSVDTAEVVGRPDTTFSTLFEIISGVYTYWVVPIDAAGNEGNAASVTTQVDEPPDFTLHSDFQTDWSGYSVSNVQPMLSIPAPYRLTTRDSSALQFDGSNDVADFGDVLDRTGTFSVEANVYLMSAGPVVSKYDGTDGWYLAVGSDGEAQFYHSDLNTALTESSAGDIPVGRWAHLAVVFDASADTVTLYVDGSQVAQSTGQTNSLTSNTASLRFGADDDSSFFEGRISEIRMWGDARTQTEIQDNLDSTLQGNEAGLDGYWRGLNTAQTTVVDKTTNGNDGSFNGTIYRPTIQSLIPFPTTETVQDKLDVHGYTSPQDQIDAGYPYLAQPVPTTAQFVEIYDAGTVIASTKIQAVLGESAVDGSVTSTVTISTKENIGDSWTDHTVGQTEVFAQTFQYVKVTVDYTSDGEGFQKAQEIETVLKAKLKSDAGSIAVTANPTTVTFNRTFTDVQGITVTPQGTTALVPVVDFDDSLNPTDFDVHLFDKDGNATTGTVRWTARGV